MHKESAGVPGHENGSWHRFSFHASVSIIDRWHDSQVTSIATIDSTRVVKMSAD